MAVAGKWRFRPSTSVKLWVIRAVGGSVDERAIMDPVSLVVAALVAGASAGLTEVAQTGVTDAYERLKAAVRRHLLDRTAADVILAEFDKTPDAYEAPIRLEVDKSGAAKDPRVQELAQALMELLDPAGFDQGKYVVDARGATGVQIGDHGNMNITLATDRGPQNHAEPGHTDE